MICVQIKIVIVKNRLLLLLDNIMLEGGSIKTKLKKIFKGNRKSLE